jgi:HAD superfamily hydrolase (TIGR01549 family)
MLTQTRRTPLFDFDGTLVDSDAALLAPFAALGVDPATIPLGLPAAQACDLAGISLEDYLAHYDESASQPFPGVEELLARLDHWGLCSNKARPSGVAELARLRWAPTVALFSDDFDGEPKRLEPLLAALDLQPADAVYVGDTDHDRSAAAAAGVPFALAGWNARVTPRPDDLVLVHPPDLLALLG